MSAMWLSVTLQADADRAEALSDALLEHGALTVSIEDADAGTPAEKPQFGEPGLAPAELWAHSRVVALFDRDCALAPALAAAASAAGFDAVPPFSVDEVAEQNWVQLTQSQFEPIRICDGMWVVPSWHAPPDPAALNIALDPGMAFGTGSHPTTRLCLQWLKQTIRPAERVLDYGCGSGILAIAAAKLGAAEVWGVDIDDKAIEAAHHNATANGVTLHLRRSSDPETRQFDAVVANILTNPLCALAPAISACVAPGGRLALSGVLEAQAGQVIRAYADHIALTVGAADDGWVRLEGRKP